MNEFMDVDTMQAVGDAVVEIVDLEPATVPTRNKLLKTLGVTLGVAAAVVVVCKLVKGRGEKTEDPEHEDECEPEKDTAEEEPNETETE